MLYREIKQVRKKGMPANGVGMLSVGSHGDSENAVKYHKHPALFFCM